MRREIVSLEHITVCGRGHHKEEDIPTQLLHFADHPKLEYQEQIHTDMRRTCNSTQI